MDFAGQWWGKKAMPFKKEGLNAWKRRILRIALTSRSSRRPYFGRVKIIRAVVPIVSASKNNKRPCRG